MNKPKYFEYLSTGKTVEFCDHDTGGPGVYKILKNGVKHSFISADQISNRLSFEKVLEKRGLAIGSGLIPNCSKCGKPEL